MVIDIDSFLNDYKGSDIIPKKEKKISLDFQKDVEDKILTLTKDVKDENFKSIVKIYSELKSFDEDLPNKLLGIKKSSGYALKTVGEKYSEEFLKNVKNNMNYLTNAVDKLLLEIDSKLNGDNLIFIMQKLNEVIKNYKLFPKEFTFEKIELSKKIKKREILINQKLESTKLIEVEKIKVKIKEELNLLKLELNKSNIKNIENKIEHLNYIIENIPKLFLIELIKEKTYVIKAIIIAEEFLYKEYKKEFEEKKDIIFRLFDDFHKYYINKDIDNALAIYDEILISFENVPEIFIEEKIEIYKQITGIFDSINNLLITSNINLFLESYNSSKIIIEAKNYIEHIKRTNKYDLKTLKELINKLNKVPNKLKSQTNSILKELKTIVEEILKNNKKSFNSSNDNNNENISTMKIKSKISDIDLKKPLLENNLQNKGEVSKNIREEINSYYEKLKSLNNKKSIITLYKKISFYLDMLHLNEFEKKKILQKVNELIKTKNI